MIAAGDTFGMADAGSLMLGAAQGAPVKAVMSLLNTSGFGIISLASGIRTAKDLEGKTLAVSPGDALTQLFPAVVAANDLDGDAIELVFMDPPAKPVAVMEKRTDALLGGIDDQYFLIRAQGLPRPRALEGRKHPAFDLAVDRITDIFLSRGVLHGGSQQRAALHVQGEQRADHGRGRSARGAARPGHRGGDRHRAGDRALAAAGARVAVTDLDQAAAGAVARELEGAVGWSLDVTDAAATEAVIRRAAAGLGARDRLRQRRGLEHAPGGRPQRGGMGPQHGDQRRGRLSHQPGRGALLAGGRHPGRDRQHRLARRQAGRGAARALRGEQVRGRGLHPVIGPRGRGRGIRVNCVCPGFVRTAMQEREVA